MLSMQFKINLLQDVRLLLEAYIAICWLECELSLHVSDFCALLFLHYTGSHPVQSKKNKNKNAYKKNEIIAPKSKLDINNFHHL